MREKRFAKIAVFAMAAVACLICLASCQMPNEAVDGNRPVFEILRESGYEDTTDNWISTLTDEQEAIISIAYDSSVELGYQGSREDWISKEVKAHIDNNGNLVVVLPDGGEFTLDYPGKSSEPSQNNLEEPEKKPVENSVELPASTSKVNSETSLVIDNAVASPAQNDAVVTVRIENNPGILGLTLALSYDESVMSLKSAEIGEAFKDVLSMTRSRSLGTGCRFIWDGIEVSPNDIKDGSILNLYFDISEDAKVGTYPIVARCGDSAFNNDMAEVNLAVISGSMTIE